MDKHTAIKLIDEHKNALINPVEMLNWTWLRVIINVIPDEDLDTYVLMASKILSR